MKATSLVPFVVMVLLWASPTTADRPESGLRCGLAMSGDLSCSAPSRPDAGPTLCKGVDEMLEREENEDDSEGPSDRALKPDGHHGVVQVPRVSSHAPRDHASALRAVRLAVPLRC